MIIFWTPAVNVHPIAPRTMHDDSIPYSKSTKNYILRIVAPLNKPTPVLSDDLVDFSSVGREVPIRFLDDFVTVAEPLGHYVQADPR
jgi:hypothetical protein